MNATEIQDALFNAIESLIDASKEVGGEDDDATLADITRDMVSDLADESDGIQKVQTFERVQMLTHDAGLVLRMADGAEFQITIVQSRAGRGE